MLTNFSVAGIGCGIGSFLVNSTYAAILYAETVPISLTIRRADNIKLEKVAIIWFLFAMLCDVRVSCTSRFVKVQHEKPSTVGLTLLCVVGDDHGRDVLDLAWDEDRHQRYRQSHHQNQPHCCEYTMLFLTFKIAHMRN